MSAAARDRSGESLRGFFITLEGIEGTGKTTHQDLLARALESRGFTVAVTREPGGTPLGRALRGLLLDDASEPPVPEAELFLLLADRAQHVQRVILPALNRGEVVIADRYIDASLAYQGAGRAIDEAGVRWGNRLATGGLVPDLTLLFELPVDEAFARIERRRAREGRLDRLDRESVEFFARVRDAYHRLARAEPDRFRIVCTREDKEDGAAEILTAVLPRLEERRRAGALA